MQSSFQCDKKRLPGLPLSKKSEQMELAYLISFLDDESPEVREHVRSRLREIGPSLRQHLQFEEILLNQSQSRELEGLLEDMEEDSLLVQWQAALARTDEMERLEEGLIVLSGFLQRRTTGEDWDVSPSKLLDELARRFRASLFPRLSKLVQFLFDKEGYKGNTRDYYSPDNSNLYQVLTGKRGNPICLAVVLILVAHRCRLKVHGCNMPRHFMALGVDRRHGNVMIDCFNGGTSLRESEYEKILSRLSPDQRERVLQPATTDQILYRFLQNVLRSFASVEYSRSRETIRKMLEYLPG
jgi:regulator of sirC expression with transglutaminase-like and TPR domain